MDPARLSESAGTYLCNAAMYAALAPLPRRVPCGFIHLPLLPAQVAVAIERRNAGETAPELGPGGAIPPSMAFPFQRRAVEAALAATLESGRPSRRPKA